MSLDLASLRRSRKPERFLAQLANRGNAGLSAVAAAGTRRFVLDTTVYIDDLAGRLPQAAADLLDEALPFHCALCVAEIVSGLGRLHPSDPRFVPGWDYYEGLFASVPAHRVLTPDAAVLVQAGIVSGVLARTQGFGKDQAKELFNDAAIYLTASKLGLSLLTANRRDCDLIQQVAGQGAFIYYAPL